MGNDQIAEITQNLDLKLGQKYNLYYTISDLQKTRSAPFTLNNAKSHSSHSTLSETNQLSPTTTNCSKKRPSSSLTPSLSTNNSQQLKRQKLDNPNINKNKVTDLNLVKMEQRSIIKEEPSIKIGDISNSMNHNTGNVLIGSSLHLTHSHNVLDDEYYAKINEYDEEIQFYLKYKLVLSQRQKGKISAAKAVHYWTVNYSVKNIVWALYDEISSTLTRKSREIL